jgi:hypothetical protein
MTTVWMTARGAGLSALVLLTVSTCIGALASCRWTPETRVVLQYVHRAAASLGLGVLVLHIAMILADSYAHVGVSGAIVPFTSSYRATWVGIGTLAAYCFVFVGALGFARGRIAGSERGVKIWRRLHGAAYGGWVLAIVHGFTSGTDSSITWVRMLYLLSALAVLAAAATRMSAVGHRAPYAVPNAASSRAPNTGLPTTGPLTTGPLTTGLPGTGQRTDTRQGVAR